MVFIYAAPRPEPPRAASRAICAASRATSRRVLRHPAPQGGRTWPAQACPVVSGAVRSGAVRRGMARDAARGRPNEYHY